MRPPPFARGAAHRLVVVGKAPARAAQRQSERRLGHQRGVDRAIALPGTRQQRIDQRRGDDRGALGKAQVVHPLAAQQAGVENVEPLEADLGQRFLGLALDPHIEALGARIGAGCADQHHVGHAGCLRCRGSGQHQIVIDCAEGGLIAPGLLHRRAEGADERARAQRLEHLAPLVGLGDEHFHPRAGGQRRLAPGDADDPRLVSRAGEFDHLAPDKAGRADERDAGRSAGLRH